MFRRHPILILFLSLLLSAAIALAIFLGTFDLDRYRVELQQTLASTLNRPVSLGEAHLSFSKGPAFDFSDISIGPAAGYNDGLKAAHLLLKLEWDDLLQGNVTFSEIVLERPQLTIDLPPATTSMEPPPDLQLKQDTLKKIFVRTLTIVNGSLTLTDRRHTETPRPLLFEELNVHLRGLALTQAISLTCNGSYLQDGRNVPFSATGSITPAANLSQWQDSALDLSADLEHFAPGPLLASQSSVSWPIGADGQLSLHAEIKGGLTTGLTAQIDARGTNFLLRLPKVWQTPRPLKLLHLQGTATRTGEALTLSDLDLRVDQLALNGQLSFESRGDIPWISAKFSSSAVPLREILETLPLKEVLPQGDRLRSGFLQIQSATLACAQTDLQSWRKVLDSLQLRLSLSKASYQLDLPVDIENISVSADWDKGRLALTDGQALLDNLPLRYSGTLEHPWENDFPLSLAVEGSLQGHTLLTLATTKPIEGLTVVGPLPFHLNANGTKQKLLANLQADLTGISAHYRDTFNKPPSLPGRLDIQAEITPDQLRLQQGKLQMIPLDLLAQGQLSRQEQHPFSLDLTLKNLDLQACRPYLPLLDQLRARGMIDLGYHLQGAAGLLKQSKGVAVLDNVGVHLTPVIADINAARGEILLYPDHAESRNLTLKLGGSPLDIQARVASFANPSVDIRVKGESVRSDDIIFYNDQSYLRQVDGHLIIDKRGIFFDPVKVKLDGGTKAIVRGAVTNFSAPEVVLDIEADYGNIDEVIALWNRPEDAPPPPEHKNGQETRVFIAVISHQGQLGNLRFQNARGDITLRHGMLTIFPLQFNVEKGFCQGHVAVDLAHGSPPMLKMSGHLENFDALAVYHELLQRKGLVTGTLRGDFYLEGLAGKRFLDTSNGGFSFTVDKGVLRKFQFLSKVFSIFNVSQILTLQLPDMDQTGMPFTSLKATAALDKGILSTSDLFIESTSMNLSLIGDLNLKQDTVDMVLGVKPLRTVDQVVTNIPIAGWILAGDEKALITAHFEIKGKSNDPEVIPIPITSLSGKVIGIFKRVLGLPGKVVSDVGNIFK